MLKIRWDWSGEVTGFISFVKAYRQPYPHHGITSSCSRTLIVWKKSLDPRSTDLKTENWRTREDSNLWPLPSEGSALSSWATSAIRIPRFSASLCKSLSQMMSHLSTFGCFSVTSVWPICDRYLIEVGTTRTEKYVFFEGGRGPLGVPGLSPANTQAFLEIDVIHIDYWDEYKIMITGSIH